MYRIGVKMERRCSNSRGVVIEVDGVWGLVGEIQTENGRREDHLYGMQTVAEPPAMHNIESRRSLLPYR